MSLLEVSSRTAGCFQGSCRFACMYTFTPTSQRNWSQVNNYVTTLDAVLHSKRSRLRRYHFEVYRQRVDVKRVQGSKSSRLDYHNYCSGIRQRHYLLIRIIKTVSRKKLESQNKLRRNTPTRQSIHCTNLLHTTKRSISCVSRDFFRVMVHPFCTFFTGQGSMALSFQWLAIPLKCAQNFYSNFCSTV